VQESIAFLVRVQCRRKESSRSLSHLLMSFLLLMPGLELKRLYTSEGWPIGRLGDTESC